MPRFLGIDVNSLSGTASFQNSKWCYVYFKNSKGESVSFSTAPSVQLTLASASGANPPAKLAWLKDGNLFVGVKIGFASAQTIDVNYEVKEK